MRAPVSVIVDDQTPSRLLAVGDLVVGDSVSQEVTFTQELREAFSQLARDAAPVHTDADFARTRGFDAPIVQGLCVTSRFSRLIGMYLPGEAAVVESLSFKFRKPVLQGATVVLTATVSRVQTALRVVRLALRVTVAGEECIVGEVQCLLR